MDKYHHHFGDGADTEHVHGDPNFNGWACKRNNISEHENQIKSQAQTCRPLPPLPITRLQPLAASRRRRLSPFLSGAPLGNGGGEAMANFGPVHLRNIYNTFCPLLVGVL